MISRFPLSGFLFSGAGGLFSLYFLFSILILILILILRFSFSEPSVFLSLNLWFFVLETIGF